MKRFPIFLCLILGAFLLVGADGCSSDPNVEGAKLDLRNQDYDRALRNLETALEKNPANSEALELKGRVLSEKAFKIADQSEHIDLIHQMIDALNKAREIDPLLSETVTNSMRFAYSSEFNRGIQAFKRGANDDSEFAVSARYFRAAADIFPDSSGAYVNEAYSYMRAEQPEDAIAPFEMALETGDTDPETYRLLAGLYTAHDRSDEGIALLEAGGELYPGNVKIQTELLNAYQVAGQIDKALDRYREAVVREPDNKLFHYNFGSLLVQVERYDEALVELQTAIDLDAEYSNAHYNLGAAYINMAVVVNTRIIELDDILREDRSNLSRDEIAARNAEIDVLVDERRELFGEAISPLETARELFEELGEDASGVCVALYQSYVQTNDLESAEGVSACAGYEDTSN